jgi:N-acylglucosamine 2-epimerase
MVGPDWSRMLTQDILPWWEEHGADDAHGGVLTCFTNDGTLRSHEKYTWSQGRWAWLAAEIAEDAVAGHLDLDPRVWRERSGATAEFLLEHAVLPDGRTVFRTTQTGQPLRDSATGALSTSVFADLFAALGIGAAVRIGALDPDRGLPVAVQILETAHARIADRTAPTEPYPVPEGYDSMAGWMNLLHTAGELLRIPADVLEPNDIGPRIRAAKDDAVEHLLGKPSLTGFIGPSPVAGGEHSRPRVPGTGDWADLIPDDPALLDTLLARHRTPGHLLELAWMLVHADATEDLERLAAVCVRALEIGWDDQEEGLLRYVDREGGIPTAADRQDPSDHRTPYETLVRDTWSTKLWWVHAEAMYATDLLSRSTGSSELRTWHDRIVDYTLRVFPDRRHGEWIQIRDRDGSPLDSVVALPVKDPFHIARALLLLHRLSHSPSLPNPNNEEGPMVAIHPLHVHRFETAAEMGSAAGHHAVDILEDVLAHQPRARVMLAAAPSQEHTLATLVATRSARKEAGIDFSRIDFFHMDDYLGLDPDAPQGFGNWLDKRVVQATGGAAQLHRIDTQLEPEDAAARYAETMGDEPFDLVLLGLGVNAHIAFNDPGADFSRPEAAAVVELDQESRRQQVDEGHFPSLADVPSRAITVTVPRLLHASHMIASVPTSAKRAAVTATVTNPPDPAIPGTALKLHPDAHLYVDKEAGADV